MNLPPSTPLFGANILLPARRWKFSRSLRPGRREQAAEDAVAARLRLGLTARPRVLRNLGLKPSTTGAGAARPGGGAARPGGGCPPVRSAHATTRPLSAARAARLRLSSSVMPSAGSAPRGRSAAASRTDRGGARTCHTRAMADGSRHAGRRAPLRMSAAAASPQSTCSRSGRLRSASTSTQGSSAASSAYSAVCPAVSNRQQKAGSTMYARSQASTAASQTQASTGQRANTESSLSAGRIMQQTHLCRRPVGMRAATAVAACTPNDAA
eukprot:366503-Chlamydomonas_euryale.AAC.6